MDVDGIKDNSIKQLPPRIILLIFLLFFRYNIFSCRCRRRRLEFGFVFILKFFLFGIKGTKQKMKCINCLSLFV